MFKVGDKVRVIGHNGSNHGAEIGTIYTALGFSGKYIRTVEWYFEPDEIELVKEKQMLKVGDKFKWQGADGEEHEEVVKRIDDSQTTLPELTIWCESGGWLRSSDCIKIEEENRWTKIVEALKTQIDSALATGEIEQAIRYAKLLDEVKSNV